MNFLRNKATFFGPLSRDFLYFLPANLFSPCFLFFCFLGGGWWGWVCFAALGNCFSKDSYFVRQKLDAFFFFLGGVTCQGIFA